MDQALKFWVKTHMFAGQEYSIFGSWFRIHFIENEGMAYGLKFGGNPGKLLLSMLRLLAVTGGFFVLAKLIREHYHKGLILCGALILAGAMGNLIDSMFYGLIFSSSSELTNNIARFLPKEGGYAPFLHGRVVDMLWLPVYEGYLPEWIPFKGGDYFIFFQPVFNIADASISIGVISAILFQKSFFRRKIPAPAAETVNTPGTAPLP
jgi:signal peptidase II